MSNLVIDALQAVGVASATIVSIELTDGRSDPIIGYVDGTDQVMVLPTVVTTDATGQVTVDLVPTSEILPGNTCYTVKIANKQFLIQKSGATQNLFEALVSDPGNLDPINNDFLLRANNLSDVDDAATSRDNLGLGDSATRNVGQGPDTVAAGDDPRFDTIVTAHNDLTDRDVFPSHPADSVSSVPSGFLTATNVQDSITELAAATTAHETDPTDAHAASAISSVPFATIEATNVQDALEELFLEAAGGGGGSGTFDHSELINRDMADQHPATAVSVIPTGNLDSTDVQAALEELTVQPASEVPFTPTGDIVATNVQAAIAEVDTELHAHETDAVDAHDATAISFAPTGDIVATDVQAAVVEVDGELHDHLTDTVDAHDASAISSTTFGTITATNVQQALEDVYAAATTGLDEASEIIFAPTGDIVATNVQDAIVEVDGELHAHINDTSDAHDASAISFVPFSTIAATDVQAAIEEVFNEASGASTASAVSFTPTGDIAATNVQDAIVEVDGELHAHITDTTDAHLATAIGFTPAGDISATNVQDAIVEIDAEFHGHENDTTDAHLATSIGISTYTNGPVNLSSTNVQAQIREVADESVVRNGTYATAGTDAMTSNVTGDTQKRLIVNADGLFEWGSGSATADTTLQRSGTGILAVGGDLTTTGLVQTGTSFRFGASGPIQTSGSGSPEGSVTAPVGSTYLRTSGAGTVQYLKDTGTGNTGWVFQPDMFVGTSTPPGTPAAGDFWYDTDETNTGITANQVGLTTVSHLSSTDVQDAISRLPKGMLAKDTTGTDVTTTVTATLTGLSLSITADVTRQYRLWFDVVVTQTPTDQWDVFLVENGVTLNTLPNRFFSCNGFSAFAWKGYILYAPSAGAKTLTLQAVHATGSSTATFFNSLTSGFMIEDIGPR